MPPQVLLVQCPPQFDIGPQPLPQEDIHKLVHTPEHAELPQPTPQTTKQPLTQFNVQFRLQLELPEQDALQLEPHELEEI